MAETYRTTFKLRRGYAEVWERNNPVLQEGEPGFALDTKVLKIGDGVTPWLELKGIGAMMQGSGSITNNYPAKARKILNCPSVPYVCNLANEESRVYPSSNRYATIIAKWDALMEAYPFNISKESIGQDASGVYEIYCYTITSNSDSVLDWTIANTEDHLKILWMSGIHGHEVTIENDDFLFFKELVENHDNNDTLQTLWDNVTFKVVPVCSPWGYENGSRVNVNGVNLNRNFSYAWKLSGEGTLDYSGEEAESEAETKAIAAFLEANKDAFLTFNRHTKNNFSATSVYAYTQSCLAIDERASFSVIKSLDGIIKKNFSIFNNQNYLSELARNLFAVQTSTTPGTMDKYFNNALGMHGYLMEICPNFNKDQFSSATAIDAQNINVTYIANMLCGLVRLNDLILSDDKTSENTGNAVITDLSALDWTDKKGLLTSGADNINDKRTMTMDFIPVKAGSWISVVNNDYKFTVATYSEPEVTGKLTYSGYKTGNNPVTIDKDCYIRIALGYANDRIPNAEEFAALKSAVIGELYV